MSASPTSAANARAALESRTASSGRRCVGEASAQDLLPVDRVPRAPVRRRVELDRARPDGEERATRAAAGDHRQHCGLLGGLHLRQPLDPLELQALVAAEREPWIHIGVRAVRRGHEAVVGGGRPLRRGRQRNHEPARGARGEREDEPGLAAGTQLGAETDPHGGHAATLSLGARAVKRATRRRVPCQHGSPSTAATGRRMLAPLPIRVVVAEDSYLVREGVRRLLDSRPELDVVATCEDLDSLLTAVAAERPDVVLTDIRMPPDNRDEGIRAAQQLREPIPGSASSSSASTPNPPTRWRCSTAGPTGVHTCSRSASMTSTSSPPRSRPSPAAVPTSIPESSRRS